MKVRPWYECLGCSRLYRSQKEAELCCNQAENTLTVLDDVILKLYTPFWSKVDPSKTFRLQFKALPEFYLYLTINIPEPNFSEKIEIDDLEFQTRVALEEIIPNDVYESVKHLFYLFSFDTRSPEDILRDALSEQSLKALLSKVEKVCYSTEGVRNYLQRVEDALDEAYNTYQKGDEVFRKLVEMIYDLGLERVTGFSENELLENLSRYV